MLIRQASPKAPLEEGSHPIELSTKKHVPRNEERAVPVEVDDRLVLIGPSLIIDDSVYGLDLTTVGVRCDVPAGTCRLGSRSALLCSGPEPLSLVVLVVHVELEVNRHWREHSTCDEVLVLLHIRDTDVRQRAADMDISARRLCHVLVASYSAGWWGVCLRTRDSCEAGQQQHGAEGGCAAGRQRNADGTVTGACLNDRAVVVHGHVVALDDATDTDKDLGDAGHDNRDCLTIVRLVLANTNCAASGVRKNGIASALFDVTSTELACGEVFTCNQGETKARDLVAHWRTPSVQSFPAMG